MDNELVAQIVAGAKARGLDPAAVLAVSQQEGLSGNIGDGGHAFGPFQMNDAGGVLTDKFPGWTQSQKQAWAMSPAGLNYALDGIARVAAGTTGREAIMRIVGNLQTGGQYGGFERPQHEGKEIQNALQDYSSFSGYGHGAHAAAAVGADPNEAAQAVQFARSYLGTPYSWGGGSPSGPTYGIDQGASTKGFDCSGLVQSALIHAGVTDIGRTSYTQWGQGTPVTDTSNLQPGDVVFYKGSDFQTGPNGEILPGHEALYIGSGKVIEAPHTGSQVQLVDLNSIPNYMGARRFVTNEHSGAAAATNATAAIGHKAQPQPKVKLPGQVQGTGPTTIPNPSTAMLAGIANTPTHVAFHDPFVFKPGVTLPGPAQLPAAKPAPPPVAFTPPTFGPTALQASLPGVRPPTFAGPAPPSFINALKA